MTLLENRSLMQKIFFTHLPVTMIIFLCSSLFCMASPAAWLPDAETFLRVFSLRDYNTRIVLLGVTILGVASGITGTFLLLQKRSLLSDTISHSCLPGVCIAFLLGEALWQNGKSLPLLLAGAAVSGVIGVWLVSVLGKWRIKEDASLAIILSIFFGFGVVLVSLIQQLPTGNAAGLSGFIYGKAASMRVADAQLIGTVSIFSTGLCLLFYKEFKLLCFDPPFMTTQGWPRYRLDFLLTGLVVTVTVIGLQAVGLLLVVALLIIPPAAARFWSNRLSRNLLWSALIGALSSALGVLISALYPKLPAGAVIVLTAAFFFLLSFIFGTQRGLLTRLLRELRLRTKVGEQHLLRALYEMLESRGVIDHAHGDFSIKDIRSMRSWSLRRLESLINRASADGFVVELSQGRYQLTNSGWFEAQRVTRNHRLWELYLIHYAETAPALVDREADAVEHILGPEITGRLEILLQQKALPYEVPASPHAIKESGAL